MKKTAPLTLNEIDLALPKEKEYSLGDGHGLYLFVKPNGSKTWKYNYRHPITLKRTNLGLGSYPNVTLEEARKIKKKFNLLLIDNIDPRRFREDEKSAENNENMYVFEYVVYQWLNELSVDLKPNGLKKISNALDNFILPGIGRYSIKDIDEQLVLELLEPVKDNGDIHVLLQCHLYLYQIMEYVKSNGLLDHNPINKLNITITKK